MTEKTLAPKKLKSYSLHNFKKIPQVQKYLNEDDFRVIETVGTVLPFKVNNYVIDELIDWEKFREDSMFALTFPQRDMLLPHHYDLMRKTLDSGADKKEISAVANDIRLQLNPHPAGQMEKNVPELEGEKLQGIQHKYRETLLFFPSQGQTCHAYCTFCFRWPQFVGMDEFKFAMKEADALVEYLKEHPEVTDVLFTGGDPLIMKAKLLATYIEPLLEADLPNLKTIRIGSKALSYWPYKFLTDADAEDTLNLMKKVNDSGIHMALMGHFNHPTELKTDAVRAAIKKVRATGTQIRTQSPVLRHINADAETWADMWRTQVDLGCIPYYMFVVRDTGAQHYFGITLEEAWHIFRNAYQQVSGVCRTVRGPSMSCDPGKVQVLGVSEIKGEKTFCLRMIQGRNPDWAARPFFAKYDKSAVWLDDLEPAFDEEAFFFEMEDEEALLG